MARKRLTQERRRFLKIRKSIGHGFAEKIHQNSPELSVYMIYWVFSGRCKNPEIVSKVLTSALLVAQLEKEKKANNVALAETIIKNKLP